MGTLQVNGAISATGTISASSFLGNASTASKLATARTIQINLASTSAVSFDGSNNITPGITGTLAIANGGTGASSRLAAAKNLTNESISSPGYVVSLTGGWANFGYTTLAQLMTAMGAASATPSMATSSNNYMNATFLKIGKLVVCTILPKVSDSTILYQEDISIPAGYRPANHPVWTYYSPTHKASGGNGTVTLAAYSSGNFRVLATYGTKPSEMKGTYCWGTA